MKFQAYIITVRVSSLQWAVQILLAVEVELVLSVWLDHTVSALMGRDLLLIIYIYVKVPQYIEIHTLCIYLECPAGYWGNDCSKRCSDTCGIGRTESCDAVNGTCTCNKCWLLDTNGTCSIDQGGAEGYQCFLDYTMSISKVLLGS